MIKTGFCVAYDWHLLNNSLPQVYEASDRICLALDKDNRSWSGNEYNFDGKAFERMVKALDVDNKIDIYYDSFYLDKLNARENCNRHRMMIAERLGLDGGWFIQVDSDEYFLNFNKYVEQLIKINPAPSGKEKAININVNLIPIFKKLEKGYLVVDFGNEIPESSPFATNVPEYTYARRNGHFDFLTKHYAIHETWARSEEELKFKLANWGHSSEELNSESIQNQYLELWRSADELNYMNYSNIHPTDPPTWPKLMYIEAQSISELIESIRTEVEYPLSDFALSIRNNRNVARIKQLFRG